MAGLKIFEGDTVWIHYWLNNDLCKVTVKSKDAKGLKVSHDIEDCCYYGAPSEVIKPFQIIDKIN
jgi:hypothetical protein